MLAHCLVQLGCHRMLRAIALMFAQLCCWCWRWFAASDRDGKNGASIGICPTQHYRTFDPGGFYNRFVLKIQNQQFGLKNYQFLNLAFAAVASANWQKEREVPETAEKGGFWGAGGESGTPCQIAPKSSETPA